TQPPVTDPAISPASETAIEEPGSRGAERSVSTTVAIAASRPCAIQPSRVSRMSRTRRLAASGKSSWRTPPTSGANRWRPGPAPRTMFHVVHFESVDELETALRRESYLADEGLAVAVHLALAMRRPLLLEGEPGVGKTEVAKTLARILDVELIRLQCYEGIDS